TTGSALGYTNWASGQPDNTVVGCTGVSALGVCLGLPVDEDCALLTASGPWSDADCNGVRVFVCETY
ncbi:MAG TPA: hypothetical protein VI299_29170, partial [Polyangiales bacterium]